MEKDVEVWVTAARRRSPHTDLIPSDKNFSMKLKGSLSKDKDS